MAEPAADCYFLRIPKEIRLIIYRNLLLPSPMLSMSPVESDQDEWSDVDSDEDSDEETLESSIPSLAGSDDSDFEEDDGECTTYITTDEANPFTKDDYERFRRHPVILRVNRQIYNEASDLLYTEGILVVEPMDLFALAKNPFDLEFGVPAELGVWRHDPFKDPGKIQPDGTVKYGMPELDGEGKMYPHVFRRFKRIFFHGNFDLEHTQNVELWIDDDTHVVRKDTADEFKKILRGSPIMKDFVKLVSLCPVLISLEIALEVEVMANSRLMMEEMEEEDEEDEEETELKIDRLMDVANERATELFLDSGICEPLLELKNVQTFDLTFAFDRDEEAGEEKYNPLPEHVKLIREMKEKIEANFEPSTESA